MPDPTTLRRTEPAACRDMVAEARQILYARFRPGRPVHHLLRQQARFIDRLCHHLWNEFGFPQRGDDIALIGTGGYGRRQLHPHSDIDLLILLKDQNDDRYRERIEQFLALLWELKLRVGHSVRSLDHCLQLASEDITVITSLMEAHRVAGSQALSRRLMAAVRPERMWDSDRFFHAKFAEWQQRRKQFSDASWNLEPNLKKSPGGLRDLQTLSWITRRHYGRHSLRTHVERELLTAAEMRALNRGISLLWRVRFALHMSCGRCQDRLYFEQQPEIAALFGYGGTSREQAVERFMKRYYRQVMETDMLCGLLLQNFREQVLEGGSAAIAKPLGKHFILRDRYLTVATPEVFARQPSTMLELFLLLAQNPAIDGIHSTTIRWLRDNLHRIDEGFRRDPANTELFMALLRSPHKVARQLQRMWRYGVLRRWLPEFNRIRGQMQFDLFHVYTVDAHSIEVVLQIHRLRVATETDELQALATTVVRNLPKPELLYIAGLYHDIAKGRGGDHSELGVRDATAFCRRHRLAKDETQLVAWLVRHHLLMSMTAQRRDISDPAVIAEFSALVGNRQRLDYLYTLTVADIRGTNPSLWNEWRARLLADLYLLTRRALQRGADQLPGAAHYRREAQRATLALLRRHKLPRARIEALWRRLDSSYFMREQPTDIAWHTATILEHRDRERPLVAVHGSDAPAFTGAQKIFVYCPAEAHHFSMLTAALEKLNLRVLDAHLANTTDGYTLSTFFVLGDPNASPQHHRVAKQLEQELSTAPRPFKPMRRLPPSRLKHFTVPLQVELHQETGGRYTLLEVITQDRSGLLARIAKVLERFPIILLGARITTLGEKVDDVFHLCDKQRQPLADKIHCNRIRQALITELSKADTDNRAQ